MSSAPSGGSPTGGSCAFSGSAGTALTIVVALLAAFVVLFFINGYVTCFPKIFVQWINDRAFLNEYERRLDKVVEHDLRKKYHVGRKLGEGVTAAVFRVQDRETSGYFALKKIPLRHSKSLQRAVEREIKILKKLRHRNITALHDQFQSPNMIWAVLEFVSGGELTNYITMQDSVWDESLAVRCSHQILSGLAYLHGMGIVHRDIKLANLLRSSKTKDFVMKIADFGAACVMAVPDNCELELHHFKAIIDGRDAIGTPCNMAPEVFNHQYGPMCDMWSFGCVVYELLLGEPPFDPYKLPHDDPEYHLKKNVRAAHYPRGDEIQGWSSLSPEAIDVVTKLLIAKPMQRLSAWEALQHPWMQMRARANGSDRESGRSGSGRGSGLSQVKANIENRRKSIEVGEISVRHSAERLATSGTRMKKSITQAQSGLALGRREPSGIISQELLDGVEAAGADEGVHEDRFSAVTSTNAVDWDEESKSQRQPSAGIANVTEVEVVVHKNAGS